jgi:hypothetical protein
LAYEAFYRVFRKAPGPMRSESGDMMGIAKMPVKSWLQITVILAMFGVALILSRAIGPSETAPLLANPC